MQLQLQLQLLVTYVNSVRDVTLALACHVNPLALCSGGGGAVRCCSVAFKCLNFATSLFDCKALLLNNNYYYSSCMTTW